MYFYTIDLCDLFDVEHREGEAEEKRSRTVTDHKLIFLQLKRNKARKEANEG
jgi:hypothetical protein